MQVENHKKEMEKWKKEKGKEKECRKKYILAYILVSEVTLVIYEGIPEAQPCVPLLREWTPRRV